MLLSICVPTYNRGKLALNLANELENIYKKHEGEIEIVFSNNGSTKETEEYEQLKSMASDHFKYFEFSENKQYVGNYNQVIRMSTASWCMILSDEDHIYEENLDYYLDYLRNHSEVSVVRARTNYSYSYVTEETYASAGQKALEAYFLQGNYISGAIYNRKFLTNEVINKLELDYRTDSDNRGYFSYPHMFVEALLLISGNFYRSSNVLIIEGANQGDQVMDQELEGVPFYASYEERLAQCEGYINFIGNLKCADGMRLWMLVAAIDKTIYLVSMQKKRYIATGHKWDDIIDITCESIKDMLFTTDIDVFRIARKDIIDYIDVRNEINK